MIDRLLAEPHRFEFFQAVRVLERWFAREQADGDAPDALAGRIVFRQSLSLAFPPSEIAALAVARREIVASGSVAGVGAEQQASRDACESRAVDRIELTPAFIGLLGAGGTLPAFYTELIAQREAASKDGRARALLDVFLHRAVVLFYRAWRKHRLAIEYEADRRRRFLPLVLSIAGIGSPALRDRLAPRSGGVADETLAHFAGALQQRPRSPAAVRQIVSAHFGVPAVLEPFIGRWFTLADDEQSTLGRQRVGLGHDAIVGARLWQRDLRVRLTLGPLPRAAFDRFLPGGHGARALRELLTLLVGRAVEVEVRLALRADDVRPARLDGIDAPRLGHDSFLVSTRSVRDRSEPGYTLLATGS